MAIIYHVIHYRLSSLKQLKVLDVCGNEFRQGLPTVITEITSLEILKLGLCQLSELPQRYGCHVIISQTVSMGQLKELWAVGKSSSGKYTKSFQQAFDPKIAEHFEP